MHLPTDRVAHTTAFDTPLLEHWLDRVAHTTTYVTPVLEHWLVRVAHTTAFITPVVEHWLDRVAHTTAFVTPVVERWLERERVSAVRLCVRRTLSGWNEREYGLWESVWDVHYLAGTRESIGCETVWDVHYLAGTRESMGYESLCETYLLHGEEWLPRGRPLHLVDGAERAAAQQLVHGVVADGARRGAVLVRLPHLAPHLLNLLILNERNVLFI